VKFDISLHWLRHPAIQSHTLQTVRYTPKLQLTRLCTPLSWKAWQTEQETLLFTD